MGSGFGLGGCHACIKYLMFAFNFIFWLVGCALVGVGIWIMVDEKFKELVDEGNNFAFLQYAGITVIVIGSIVMIVGFFGCCGAIRESQCLLVMFFICMLILFLALVGAGVYCLAFTDKVIDEAQDEFGKQVDSYKEKGSELVDIVQKAFNCCGKTGVIDYGRSLPESCGANLVDAGLKPGCNKEVVDQLKSHIAVAAGVTLGAGALMLLGMIFSMLLCCAIRDME